MENPSGISRWSPRAVETLRIAANSRPRLDVVKVEIAVSRYIERPTDISLQLIAGSEDSGQVETPQGFSRLSKFAAR